MKDTTFSFKVECISQLFIIKDFLAMTSVYAGFTVSLKEAKTDGTCIITTQYPVMKRDIDFAMYQSYFTRYSELTNCWRTLECGEIPRPR